jgi:lysozyme
LSPTDFIRVRAQLQRDEGSKVRGGRHIPYKDTVGKLTIGYGHNLDDNGLKQKFVDLILDDDIRDAIADLVVRLPWFERLDPERQAVLVNMGFNLGVLGLLQFKRTLESIRIGDYELAAIQMLESRWADQVGDRALRLADQMRTGRWVD